MSNASSKPTQRIVLPRAFRTRVLSAHVELKPLIKVRDPFALGLSQTNTTASPNVPSADVKRRCGSV